MIVDLKEINKRIKEFQEKDQPQRLILGYKTYSKLMKEDRFVDQLTKDSNDPLVRFYKDIKIKLVPEKYCFKIE